jgi:hypothetical protein
LFTLALRRGDWEEISVLNLSRDEAAKLPTLATSSLDELYGKSYSPSPTELSAVVNPLNSFVSRLVAVAAGNGSNRADVEVGKARNLLADYIRVFEAERPDWLALQTAQQELAKLFDAGDPAFAFDSRSAELKGIWLDIASAATKILNDEVAAYRDKNGERRRNLERAIVEVFKATSSRSLSSQPKKAMEQIEPHVRELAYVFALAPGWTQTKWKTGRAQPSEATLAESLAVGREALARVRAEYEAESAVAINRELGMLRQIHDAGYLDGVAALESAHNLPEESATDASARYSKYEQAHISISGFLRKLRHATSLYPTIAERELGGVKIAGLVQRVAQQQSEAQDGMDRLAIRVRDDAKGAYQTWVKNLSGDKKRIFDSVGRPGEARGDIWYYRTSTAGRWTTTVYTFRAGTLVGNRSVPWYE